MGFFEVDEIKKDLDQHFYTNLGLYVLDYTFLHISGYLWLPLDIYFVVLALI